MSELQKTTAFLTKESSNQLSSERLLFLFPYKKDKARSSHAKEIHHLPEVDHVQAFWSFFYGQETFQSQKFSSGVS